MTALIKDQKTDKLGTDEQPYPVLLSFPVEANTTIYGGAMVATNAAGNAVPASSTEALKIWGRCDKQVANTTANGFGAAGALMVQVRQGVYFYNMGTGADAITNANAGSPCYAIDDNTVGLTDGNGTRPYAGVIYGLGETGGLPQTGLVAVFLGLSTPYGANTDLSGASAANKARAVATSIPANTGTGTGTLTASANGALPSQDGVTLVAGDALLIPSAIANTTAKDSGPWIVVNPGGSSAKWVLTRPDWYQTGATIVQASDVNMSGEGSQWAGSTWRSFAAKGQLVDTNDPVLYPRAHLTSTTISGSTTVNGLYIGPDAQTGASNETGARAFSVTPTAGRGTGTLVVTGTNSDVISLAVINF